MNKQNHKHWRKLIAPYEKTDLKRSIWQMINTFVPFIALWCAAYFSLSVSYWLTLALAVVAGGLLVRIFIIFHDCCHGSFFVSKKANRIVGTITGILTFCPYEQWRYSHARHHATSGNLDQHGEGDIWTVTVEEYLEMPRWKRLAYRLYRNPLIMFTIGPLYIFLIEYRFNRKGAKKRERFNTYLVNVSIVVLNGSLCWLLGWKEFLMVQGPLFFVAAACGVWLFYVQHQFEGAYFEKAENWNHVDAALKGSSFYKLPKVLNWFSGNIGFHHIHHLSARVPNYHLHRAHHENEMFQDIKPVTLLSSLKSLSYRIWDENRKKLVGFGYVKQFLESQEKENERKKAS